MYLKLCSLKNRKVLEVSNPRSRHSQSGFLSLIRRKTLFPASRASDACGQLIVFLSLQKHFPQHCFILTWPSPRKAWATLRSLLEFNTFILGGSADN